jgi:hypothetical protein
MAPVLTDYRQRSSNIRSQILKSEEQRLEVEQKLRSMTKRTSHIHQRRQIQHIENYFTRLNQESQRAEQRNLNFLNDLTQAQQRLEELHSDVEHLICLKEDYLSYLESHYPTWQMQRPLRVASDHSLTQYIQHQSGDHLQDSGNLRHGHTMNNLAGRYQLNCVFFFSSLVVNVRQSYDVNSSMLFKRYEDQLNNGFDRTMSPLIPIIPNDMKEEQQDDVSLVELNSFAASRMKRHGSLRLELNQLGLYFLLDYLESNFKDNIDNKGLYRRDQPTIAQKRTILSIANEQQQASLKDLDLITTSMVLLDQLKSTIARTTTHQCLLTEDILSANVKDLDKDIIAQMLPEQDRSLWLRLVEHFVQLVKLRIMTSQILAEKFTVALLPIKGAYLHEKGKSLLKHIVDIYISRQVLPLDNEMINDRSRSVTANSSLLSSWLVKLANGRALNDDEYDDKSETLLSSNNRNQKTIHPSIVNASNIKDDPETNSF